MDTNDVFSSFSVPVKRNSKITDITIWKQSLFAVRITCGLFKGDLLKFESVKSICCD